MTDVTETTESGDALKAQAQRRTEPLTYHPRSERSTTELTGTVPVSVWIPIYLIQLLRQCHWLDLDQAYQTKEEISTGALAEWLSSRNSSEKAFPEHWSLFLHCTICFGFYHNPHTLECGHSFCKRCLRRLVEIARDDNPDVRLRRLTLSCPTCRHPFKAKPVLRGHVRTCIVLKHLVELWRKECRVLMLSPPQVFRSICTQTDRIKTPDKEVPTTTTDSTGNLQEEFTTRYPQGDDYFETVIRQVVESSDELEQEAFDETINKIGLLHIVERRDNSSSDSESSVYTSGDEHSPTNNGTGGNNGAAAGGVGSGILGTGAVIIGVGLGAGGAVDRGGTGGGDLATGHASISNISIPDMFHLSGNIADISDGLPARLLLVAVWFVYSLLIVGLAETFLPYVLLFTAFFLLIILK